MIEIILLLACCCFIFIVVLAGWFLNRGEEGDECEGKDENGTYEIDDKLKCVLKSCGSGYYKSGKKCLVDQSGVACVPTGTPDPQGIYLTNSSNVCTLSCEDGYVVDGDECSRLEPRRDASTLPDDFALGSMIHLDRHSVDCGPDGLTGFSLDMEGTDKMLYNYKCHDELGGIIGGVQNTPADTWGDNNMYVLDRHTVDCGKKPINQFRFYRPTNNQIAYQYKCNQTEATGACRTLNVISTNTDYQKTTSLMEADPQCDKGEVLTKFKHYRSKPGEAGESAAYEYTCCKL